MPLSSALRGVRRYRSFHFIHSSMSKAEPGELTSPLEYCMLINVYIIHQMSPTFSIPMQVIINTKQGMYS